MERMARDRETERGIQNCGKVGRLHVTKELRRLQCGHTLQSHIVLKNGVNSRVPFQMTPYSLCSALFLTSSAQRNRVPFGT